jgi:hypothetical protein
MRCHKKILAPWQHNVLDSLNAGEDLPAKCYTIYITMKKERNMDFDNAKNNSSLFQSTAPLVTEVSKHMHDTKLNKVR